MIVCAVIFLAGLAGSIYLLMPTDAAVVEIVQNGKTLYTFDLSKQTGRERIEISCEEGTNIVCIGPEGVYVEEADCADQTCVKMGCLKSSALPIVCLPHKLVIRYAENVSEIDGVTG